MCAGLEVLLHIPSVYCSQGCFSHVQLVLTYSKWYISPVYDMLEVVLAMVLCFICPVCVGLEVVLHISSRVSYEFVLHLASVCGVSHEVV